MPHTNLTDYYFKDEIFQPIQARFHSKQEESGTLACIRVLKASHSPLLGSAPFRLSATESLDMAQAASSQPERKRPRLSPENEDEDEKPFVNHATLYFDDGNAILTAGRMLFCVHRSLLSKHSSVLRDLFEESHARFRGLLHLEMEETSEEVEALLNVIYDGLRVDVQRLSVETFPSLSNILRMATKYKVGRPCDDILARIRAEWPANLVQHDAKERELRDRLSRIYGNANRPPGIQEPPQHAPPPEPVAPEEDTIVHPASVISLLRECGYDDADLLYPLFYALSCTTWQFGGPSLGLNLAPLSSADVERLVVGTERLRTAHISFAVVTPEFPASPTHPPHFCILGATQIWSTMLPLLLPPARRRSRPIEDWYDMIPVATNGHLQYHVCALCARAIAAKVEAVRQRLWASLPVYFELS